MLKFYHVYRTTCRVDGAVYYGIVVTDDPFGLPTGDIFSKGERLLNHVKKHGAQHFFTTFLYVFPLEKDADTKLQELIKAWPGDPRQLLNWTTEDTIKAQLNRVGHGAPKGNQNSTGHVVTERHKAILKSTHKDVKWFHNMKEEIQIKPGEEIPPGFVRGRIPRKKS